MVVLDTNIFIYVASGVLSPRVIAGVEIGHASITRIEALGYRDISKFQELVLLRFFEKSADFSLTEEIVQRAILLKQEKKMSLGDAIIAATALESDSELWTANTEDFRHIDGLKLRNPLEA